MSAVDPSEARRLRILQKLNNKYKDTPAEEEVPLNDNLSTEGSNPIIKKTNNESEVAAQREEPKTYDPTQSQAPGEKKTSAFDEYKKLKESEAFSKNLSRKRSLTYFVFGIFTALILTNILPIKNLPLVHIYVTLEVLFLSHGYLWKKRHGTTYFDKKDIDIPFLGNILGQKSSELLNIFSTAMKIVGFIIERVNGLALYLVTSLVLSEILLWLQSNRILF